jgi:hypothetical protein
MSHLSALAAIAAAGLLALPGSLPAAMAETVVVHDGAGDAPPAMDVTRVRFRNNAEFISARVHVAELTRRPLRFVSFLFYRTHAQDDGASASAWIDEGGDLTTMLSHQPDDQGQVDCRFHVHWRAADDFVYFRVPRRCITAAHVRDTGSLRMYASTATVEADGEQTEKTLVRKGPG